MKDRNSVHPGRVELTPVPGEQNKYDLKMADDPLEVGDAPVKKNLLTDETAGLYPDLPDNPVPNDAFLSLAKTVYPFELINEYTASGNDPVNIQIPIKELDHNVKYKILVTLPEPLSTGSPGSLNIAGPVGSSRRGRASVFESDGVKTNTNGTFPSTFRVAKSFPAEATFTLITQPSGGVTIPIMASCLYSIGRGFFLVESDEIQRLSLLFVLTGNGLKLQLLKEKVFA